jgi:hypothetical protein
VKSKLLFHILSISFITFFLFACGTNSNGVFEKRKHLKGWHFKKNNFSLSTSLKKEKKALKNDSDKEEPDFYFQKNEPLESADLIPSEKEISSNTVEKKDIIIGIESEDNQERSEDDFGAVFIGLNKTKQAVNEQVEFYSEAFLEQEKLARAGDGSTKDLLMKILVVIGICLFIFLIVIFRVNILIRFTLVSLGIGLLLFLFFF